MSTPLADKHDEIRELRRRNAELIKEIADLKTKIDSLESVSRIKVVRIKK